MKQKNIILTIVMTSLFLFSCEEQIMEWQKDPSHGEITKAELPLELAEKISRYEALNTYTDFTLGVGVGLDLYIDDTTYRRIANENFDELTVGYGMKHGPMVNSEGKVEFEDADAFVAKAKEAGLSVFGHTLIWYNNQNASYLNGLIAPTVIPGTAGSNSLDLSGLKDSSFTDWNRANPGEGITVVNGEGLSAGTNAVKMISSASSANAWDLQLISPDIPVDTSHTYEFSFYIRSEQPGQGRVSFVGLGNNYPYKDWFNDGSGLTEAFETTTEWQQVKITIDDFTSEVFKFAFDLGYLADVTYYVDVDNILVVDPEAGSSVENLITNGDFEGGTLDSWGGWGNGSTRSVSADGEGYGDAGFAMVLTNPTAADPWSAQPVFTFDTPLEQETEYFCTFMVKANTAATLQVQIQGADYNGDYYGGIEVGTTWQQVELTIIPSKDDRTLFMFDFGTTEATYHIDDIVLTTGEQDSGSGPIILEKSDDEKAEIIEDAMEDWISQMVGHYKNDIKAWDVVNEPMLGDGRVRNGEVDEPDADDFHWVKYLGEEYAVMAFKFARQYGNETDVLFINDYNLEYSLDKCDGLIDYVEYIESQGARVDGIGTQMHLSLDSDSTKMVQMFQKLAASGKLIKISELDVRLGTNSPTGEQLADQAAMYQLVLDLYIEHIPEAQRYGVTIWGISDNAKEHEYWLPDESPNVWDDDYERKNAYKGVADGLAGRNVSEDFTGELQD